MSGSDRMLFSKLHNKKSDYNKNILGPDFSLSYEPILDNGFPKESKHCKVVFFWICKNPDMASATGSEAQCQAKFAKHKFKCDVCRKPCNSLKSYLKHVRLHTSVELTKV